MPLHGWIADYNEQGMEADYWLTFQDEQFVDGDRWDRTGMHILQPGDHLTIYDPEGEALWEGALWAPRARLVDEWLYQLRQRLTAARGYRRWYPEGGEPATWLRWFQTRPHLRADLVPKDASS